MTHGDRAAWEGTAVFHELGASPWTATIPSPPFPAPSPRCMPTTGTAGRPCWHRTGIRTTRPSSTGRCGPCLGTALRALRTTSGFEGALGAVVDVGGDTDTVAAVTGGLAGAVYGLGALPERWTRTLHVPLPEYGDRVLRAADLVSLTERLDGNAGIHREKTYT